MKQLFTILTCLIFGCSSFSQNVMNIYQCTGTVLYIPTSCIDSITYSNLPTLSTSTTSSIGNINATSGGNISSDGGNPVTVRGVCWNTTTNPLAAGNHTTDGTGTGTFASSITGLTPSTTYYVRAYATNTAGTAYGNEINFITLAGTLATLSTTVASGITSSNAISGGIISSDGGNPITARGVCWSTSTNPIATGSHTNDGTGTGTFSSTITGLVVGTTYYVRAYATNNLGTAYGNEINFTTAATLATLSTIAASTIENADASSGGNITNDGGNPITGRGVCWDTVTNPVVAGSHTNDGTGLGTFTSAITGLAIGTTYYVRAYATNNIGTAYGNEIVFTTTAIPIVLAQSYGGGKIFYIDSTGQHGLIAATTNQSSGIQWYNGSYIITGTTGSAIGLGNTNTSAIVTIQGVGSYAAKLCYDLVLGGYSDWYLPSIEELNRLYLEKNYLGPFNGSYYWSSTESNVNTNDAYAVDFNNGNMSGNTKPNALSVRAIRTF